MPPGQMEMEPNSIRITDLLCAFSHPEQETSWNKMLNK